MKYYIPEHGEDESEARELVIPSKYERVSSQIEVFAAQCCEHARNSWEWDFPKMVNVIDDESITHQVLVDREMRPYFNGRVVQ